MEMHVIDEFRQLIIKYCEEQISLADGYGL